MRCQLHRDPDIQQLKASTQYEYTSLHVKQNSRERKPSIIKAAQHSTVIRAPALRHTTTGINIIIHLNKIGKKKKKQYNRSEHSMMNLIFIIQYASS